MDLNYGLAKGSDIRYPYGLIKNEMVIHSFDIENTLCCALEYWLDHYDTVKWEYSDIEELLLPGALL